MTDLPANWKTKTVGELADTQLGKMLNKGKQSGKFAKPYLRTDNVHWGKFDLSEIKEMDILPEEEEKYLARNGDLLMCEGGASGRTAIWNQNYNISFQNHVHRIRPKDIKEITPKYLLYYFEWYIKNGFANDLIKGVTISSLSQSGLRSIDVAYPPLAEQHKIVEILEDHLSHLDAALADVKQAKVKAAQFRRSLLQAAFTGNLGSDGTRLMTELPDEWKRVNLNYLGNWVTGATPQSKDPLNFGDEVEFVTPSDIGYGGRLGVVERRISELGASRVRKLKAPSVNLVCIGTIGKVALANREVTTNQQINSLEPNESVVLPNFAMWLLASPKIQEALWKASSSTTVAILNKGNLCKIETSIPPLPEQHKIVEILEEHLSRLDASVALADAMEKQSAGLRRSLLQAAFTGQLTKEVASV